MGKTKAALCYTFLVKKIFLLLGHPDKQGMCGRLAEAYESGAKAGGHEIRRMDIGEMKFDPILWKGYRAMQELEPDLKEFQANVQWADHVVIVYPVWWVGMPALLKGLFDRAWLPGSAFRYIKMKSGKRTMFWHRMYRGKTARTILTSGTAPWLVRFLPGNVNAQLKWGILWFAGFSVKSLWLGPSENQPEPVCSAWCTKVYGLGERGK
jgi:NAD(P)H dehydrogenase (quinone)